jgi:hypothetical protein
MPVRVGLVGEFDAGGGVGVGYRVGGVFEHENIISPVAGRDAAWLVFKAKKDKTTAVMVSILVFIDPPIKFVTLEEDLMQPLCPKFLNKSAASI